eukprot:TRINITY_DN28477_c0_g1_i2.p2 TRINITY_DN28477_c0_g1~~TRINITY_DN28477_c0_g1_i2.p2  ORF type:complete len:193 (+),score=34.03 TRINITY_DN28477_c0_g1_i2:776-1354(+)
MVAELGGKNSQVLDSPQCQFQAFEDKVMAAVTKALRASCGVRLQFRTRVTFSRSVRLSTPLQGDLLAALRDWRAVRAARGEACLRRSPHTAQKRWRQTSTVWAAIWEARGAVTANLQRQLAQKEAACAPLWMESKLGCCKREVPELSCGHLQQQRKPRISVMEACPPEMRAKIQKSKTSCFASSACVSVFAE